MVPMRKMMNLAAAAAIATFGGLAVETVAASPAQAQCAYGGFGGFGGGFCDSDYWPDGSFNHCVTSRPETSGSWMSIRIRSGW